MGKKQVKTRFRNVYKEGKWRYYAQKRSKRLPKGKVFVRGTTARQAARRLNYVCRKHKLKLPNPKFGFELPGKTGRKCALRVKEEFPAFCIGCKNPLSPIFNPLRCGRCPLLVKDSRFENL